MAATPRIHSAWISRSCGRVVWSIGNHPVRTVLDKGGRSYGSNGSSPLNVICPGKPSSRSASAARRPAREAPTITTRSMDVTELVVTDLLLVIIIYLPSLLRISGHQLCQYLWPEPDMRPLHAQPSAAIAEIHLFLNSLFYIMRSQIKVLYL